MKREREVEKEREGGWERGRQAWRVCEGGGKREKESEGGRRE